ncbi:MAG: hypothetical protein Kow006_02170 [Gammaproteobacteria bacterium]
MTEETRFDRRRSLADLLPASDKVPITRALGALLQGCYSVTDEFGEVFISSNAPGEPSIGFALQWDLDEVGYLKVDPVDESRAPGAVMWLELLMKANARYMMAADLHDSAVQADYEALQQAHAELQASEARYRSLSESLTERVEEQVRTIERTQRTLYQAEKLASVGRLAAGVAHEINNPIGFIRSNLASAVAYLGSLQEFGQNLANGGVGGNLSAREEWQRRDLDESLADFVDLLEESREGVDRVSAIVRRLRIFSGVDRGEWEEVDLNEVLVSARAMVEPQLPSGVTITEALSPLPCYPCQAALMGEVFFNLLLNAVQAVEGKGQVGIASRVRPDGIEIRISDTGRGIPEAIRERIFDPFFTTREVGQGAGLGLTVANDAIRSLGGSIEFQSREGEGSVFIVKLPVEPGRPV